MRVLLQRVSEAWVEIEGRATPKCGLGLVALVGFGQGDHEGLLEPMAAKMMALRIFDDGEGRMNLSLDDCGGTLVLVSQFTLYAGVAKGRRPSFTGALEPAQAEGLFQRFGEACRRGAPNLIMGEFGAKMRVHLVNDGPVTILLDSTELKRSSG